MRREITEIHRQDAEGNPTGGHTTGLGIDIVWQDGPLGRGTDRLEPNGAFVEGVIQAALGRLQFYQTTTFKCQENAVAITRLEAALHWLQHRTEGRERRNVEGTHEI